MELESLKYIWQDLDVPAAGQPDREEVLALLQKKSRGPVARMQRNLKKELIVVALAYPPTILFYWIGFEGRLSLVGWLMLGLMVFFVGYFYRKNRLLREMQCVQCHVRSNLERQIRVLKKYVRFYLLAGTLILPVMVIVVYFVIRSKYNNHFGSGLVYRLEHPQWWAHPLFWLVLLVPFTLGSYYLNVWYVNKLYGRHIKKLQELLREMNEE